MRYFDIVPRHQQLVVEAHMRVRTSPGPAIPGQLEPVALDALKRLREDGRLWDFFQPSPQTPISPAVLAFAETLQLIGFPNRSPASVASAARFIAG